MNPEEATAELAEIASAALSALKQASSTAEVKEVEVTTLGRKGRFSQLSRSLGELAPEGRKLVGRASNEVRTAIQSAVAEQLANLAAAESVEKMQAERLDVTLPGRRPRIGRLHPLTQVLDEVIDTFTGLGFRVAEGPIVETDYYNFEALNFTPDHPARSMHDTYYVESDESEQLLLRTHTSPMQIRLMQSKPPPLCVVIPGLCCRRDEVDANHLSVFTQLEGLVVDDGVSFADLKGTLEVFAKAMFGPDLRVRMHPSYFPFTEPSAEVYVSCFACDGSGCRVCRGEGWIEIMGAGMVHPNVFKAVGYDPEISGFAFGMGIERIAKLKFQVSDLRFFYENDLRFLGTFA